MKADFEQIVRSAERGDFVYLDPPYHPVSKTACFTDYTSGGFSFEDQERLARVFRRLSDRGVLLMLSNSSRSNNKPDNRATLISSTAVCLWQPRQKISIGC